MNTTSMRGVIARDDICSVADCKRANPQTKAAARVAPTRGPRALHAVHAGARLDRKESDMSEVFIIVGASLLGAKAPRQSATEEPCALGFHGRSDQR
jgi:hypothetical protein